VKFTESDEKLKKLAERRNISKSRKRQYNSIFREIYNLIGKTPNEIVNVGKKEQQPFIDENGIPQLLEIEDRIITKYQEQYIKYLNSKRLAESTKVAHLSAFRCLLSEYNIKLPKNHKFNIPKYRVRKRDLPTFDNVGDSLAYCKNSRDKAIITLMATSGIRESDVVSFTVGDFLNATAIYHDGKIESLLSKNPLDIVPCWDFYPLKTEKEGNLCITFNTGECTKFIFQHLEERIKKNKSVAFNSSLFYSPISPHFLSTGRLMDILLKINMELGLGKDRNGKYGKFRAHNLRKLFSTTCRRNITNVVVNRDKFSELDLVSIFTGHTLPNMSNSEVFDAVDDEDGSNNYLRRSYEELIPYLTIDKKQNPIVNKKDCLEDEIMKIKNSVDVLLNNREQLVS
jgi:integrase